MSIERIRDAFNSSPRGSEYGLTIEFKAGRVKIGVCSECKQLNLVSKAKAYQVYEYDSGKPTLLCGHLLCIDCWKKLAAEINLEGLMK